MPKGNACACPYCEAALTRDRLPYCQACGVEIKYCPTCKAPLPREAGQCPACGAAV